MMRNIIELCLAAFRFAIQESLPAECVKRNLLLSSSGDSLIVNNRTYELRRNVHIIAVGKAVAGMVRGAENILGEHVVNGIASVPVGSSIPSGLKTVFHPGALHNLPDSDAVENADKITEFLKDKRAEDQIILFLISGGGSALLPSPVEGISLDEKLEVIRILATNGADIKQLNIVRSALSNLKGGKLAKLGTPSKMVSLIISDVIGDPVQLISSGPTVLEKSDNRSPLEVLKELNVSDKIPDKVLEFLSSTKCNNTLDAGDVDINNLIVCNNEKVLEQLVNFFNNNKTQSSLVTSSLEGDATELGVHFADFILQLSQRASVDKKELQSFLRTLNIENTDIDFDSLTNAKRIVLLFGGETTVKFNSTLLIGPDAKGGRNQEFVLSTFKRLLEKSANSSESANQLKNFAFFSLGTDGQDGPTDAAGAFITSDDVRNWDGSIDHVTDALDGKNSYGFWATQHNKGANLVKTGKTGTNLMDVQILYFDFT
ncbi:MOFRL family domain-containing protein [Ditylenchus destructor]|nr:MOFRL family domain-containing protein [Ditylenchus destructor]